MFLLYINKKKLKVDWEFSPALAIGAAADRGRMLPCIVFMFIWSTIIYDPIACWTWNPAGWTFKMGGLDFAGGTPVHISSGAAALAYSIMLGKRRGYNDVSGLPYRPHNVTHIVLGTVFLWVGWFGFNGGSALQANSRAVMAILATHLAACAGALTWSAIEWMTRRKPSVLGMISGAVAGLGTITPASGFVAPWHGIVIGVIAGGVCFWACTSLKNRFDYDDTLDVFGIHGVGGLLGTLMTGVFATASIGGASGLLEGDWKLVLTQAYGVAVVFVWTGGATYVLLKMVDVLAGLRVSHEQEVEGLDITQHGEALQ
jgi:ammonium transporter, Amt family